MNPLQIIANAAARRLDRMFPGYFNQSAKHDHYADFGYPQHVTFELLFRMYTRNGIAAAGVDKTVLKTWQDNPQIWETEDPKETALESDIRQRLDDLRFWQAVMEADRRSLVGKYSGLILRFADSKRFNEPVDTVPGGLDGLVEVIPAWEEQLRVAQWDTNELSENYGEPTMFQFNEAAVDPNENKIRSFDVHPDRVIIWSRDGTVHGRSALEPGFNDLLDMEKIKGAGGEGFWKNAKSSPILTVDKDADIKAMAEAMGVAPDEVADKMDEQVRDWQRGFDRLLMLQGMQADSPAVTLPTNPDQFFMGPLQSFAASLGIPVKILVGSQTGERASTEDADEWNQTNMARRSNIARPNIMRTINRLERVGILPKRDWHLHWTDLTESSISEKIERADKMASINQKMLAGSFGGSIVFTEDEIRGVVEMEPLTATDFDEGEEDERDAL